MEKLSFYDVKTKAKFDSDNYQVREKGGRFFAVTKSLKGTHERLARVKQGPGREAQEEVSAKEEFYP